MNFRTLISFGITGLMVLGVSGAQAANCSAGNYVGTASSTYLNTTNVTIMDGNVPSVAQSPSDCYGHANVGTGNSPATVATFANTTPLFGGGWTGLVRQSSTGTSATAFMGLTFGITGVNYTAGSGSFTLTIIDGNGAAPLNLPVKMDLAFTLKAGSEQGGTGGTDFYFFDEIVLDTANPGSYQVAIVNNNNIARALSDITVLGRDFRSQDPACPPGDPFCTPTRVPEPGSMALVGLALAATGLTMRRRRDRV